MSGDGLSITMLPPAYAPQLTRIEKLLALQVRLLAISCGLERDGKALAHAKHDVAAVCRGELDEIRPGHNLEAFDLVDDALGNFMADGISDPAVDHRRDVFGHAHTPSSARAGTRHVAAASISARRWLQRMGWFRRAAVILRPSDTTGGAR